MWIADIKVAEEEGCHFRRTDVSQLDDIQTLCDEVLAHGSRLDIYVNNAAIAGDNLLADADPERFWRVNQLGVEVGIKEAAARLQAGGSVERHRTGAGQPLTYHV